MTFNWVLCEMTNGVPGEVGHAPSGDACKSMAKRMNRSESRQNLGKEFLIRDPSGRDWMRSVNVGSWRMRWEWC